MPLVNAAQQVGTLRYALVVLALLWAAAVWRYGLARALVAGLLFVECAMAFWVAGLARPYGLFLDAEITRWAADVSVRSAHAVNEGALAVVPPATVGTGFWAALGLSGAALRALPSWLPLVTAVLPGLLVLALWRDPRAPLAATLVLAFLTGELDTLAGVGFLPGAWARPGASLVLLVVMAAVLAADRLPVRVRLLACGLCALSWALVAAPAEARGLVPTLLLLTGDQWPWVFLGAWGLSRDGGAAPRALVAAGSLLTLAAGLGAPVDAWGAHALYRLGILMAAAGPVRAIAGAVGERLPPRFAARLSPWDVASAGQATLLTFLLPLSFLVQWSPYRLDATYELSAAPLAPSVGAAMAWVRANIEPEATVVAAGQYAVAVAVLGERRVLRAPGFPVPEDDGRRARLEGLLVHGGDLEDRLRRYRVRYLFLAPGDFQERRLERPEDVAGRGGLQLLYQNEEGMRVFAVPQAPKERAPGVPIE